MSFQCLAGGGIWLAMDAPSFPWPQVQWEGKLPRLVLLLLHTPGIQQVSFLLTQSALQVFAELNQVKRPCPKPLKAQMPAPPGMRRLQGDQHQAQGANLMIA